MELPWPTITAASGGWVLLGIFVVALVRGKLVPRSTLDDIIKSNADITRDRDKWQDVALRALGVADKMTTQGEVTTAIVASLPDPAAEEQL